MNAPDLPREAVELFLRRRREALARHATRIGLDYAVVARDPGDPARRLLELHFVPSPDGAKHQLLDGLTAENFRFFQGEAPADGLLVLEPAGASRAGEVLTLPLRFTGAGGAAAGPVFTVELSGVAEIDPFFSRASFSAEPAPLDEDCAAAACPPPPAEAPPAAIDYLARDYGSFRQVLIERLGLRLPRWKERSPADQLVTLAEVLADAADQLSYFQDAVATEAYLGTARRRISVRRHARLVGYKMNEGTSARAWVRLETTADGVAVEPGARLLPRVPGAGAAVLPTGSPQLQQFLATDPITFETLHPVELYQAHNALPIYTWGSPEYALPQGATAATLAGTFPHLAAGDVLIFEEVKGRATGLAEDADPQRRHVVRLTRAEAGEDPLGESLEEPPAPSPLTEIAWHAADALPFPLAVSKVLADGTPVAGIAVARGNVVLADHGRTVGGTAGDTAEPLTVTAGRFRPRLFHPGLTHRVPYDPLAARARPAAEALAQDPQEALPVIDLSDGERVWQRRCDLLSSDRFAADFVVELEDDGHAVLRFGDGTLGRRPAPGTVLSPRYRVGRGVAGNLGAGSLLHLVSDDPAILAAVAKVDSPLPGRGGREPETLAETRRAAPGRLLGLLAGTPEQEFARLASRHPGVARAAARLRWTGSWHRLVVAVERRGGAPVDAAFQAELRAFLEDHRLGGWELAVEPLAYVGLDILLTVQVAPGAVPAAVERRLLEEFSNRDLPDGSRGFFHPDNFTFGESVYLSRLIDRAMAVPGVAALDLDESPPRLSRFRRFGEPSRGELASGQIRLAGTEIARVDNDSGAPERGRIRFFLEGGR